MSGGMGYYDGGLYDDGSDGQGYQEPVQPQQQQGKNPLRDHLNRVEQQNTELQKQLAALLKENQQAKITSQLQAKGYDPAVASLYGGEPEKLDEWLTSVGPLLAKQPSPTGDTGAGQQQTPPATTVPADGQAAMQQMQQIGNMAAPPAGTDAEQMAQINGAQDAASLMQYLNSQGNPYHFNG